MSFKEYRKIRTMLMKTRFRRADSNKDGVQDLEEFRWLGDVEEMVRKLFQHYDQVLYLQQNLPRFI